MAAVGHQNDFLLLMTLARCLNASGLGLLFSASTDLLYQLTHPKDTKTAENADGSQEVEVHRKVQKTLTNIATLSTLLDFFLAPMIGSFMDSVGRLPTMMLAMGCSSLVRFCLAVSPSLKLYMFYRALVSITGNAWLSASSAALGDVFGRGTARFAEASSRVQRFALLAMMLGTFAGHILQQCKSCGKMGERAPESLRPSGNVASHGGRSCWMYEGIPDVSEQISTGLVLVRFSPQQSPVRSGGFEYCYGASRPCCHLGPGFSTSEVSQTLDSFNGIDPYASVADCRCVPYLSAHTHFEASGFRLCLPIGQLVQRVLFLKQRLFNATQLAGFEPTSQLLPMRRFIFRTVPATSCRIGGVGIGCSQCS